MRCPRCSADNVDPQTPCQRCGFHGDPDQVEALAHLKGLRDEVDGWLARGITDLTTIRRTYTKQVRELEIALDLRAPPVTADVARSNDLWRKLYRQARFLTYLRDWHARGYLHPHVKPALTDEVERYVTTTKQRLEGLHTVDYLLTDEERLSVADYLLIRAQELADARGFTSPDATAVALEALRAEKARLAARLGIPAPAIAAATPERATQAEPAAQQETTPTPSPVPELVEAPPVPEPPRPKVPFRERLVQTLLSERTLHAILFLAIFLLFSSAITFVIWGWKDFSPPLRVAIPAAFTLTFFAMAWFMRQRTALRQSGVALTAIAALLIPVDFYTAYVNLDIMPDRWAEFWLLTSLICLGAYVGVALRLQSGFFGYLVATAAGSAVLASIEIAHQAAVLSRDWYAAGLSLLALVLTALAAYSERRSRRRDTSGPWLVYAAPLRAFALLTVGVLMPLALGWRFIDRDTYDALHRSATVTWWIGGLLLGWGAVRYRSRTLGLIATVTLPVAVTLVQADLFYWRDIHNAWHALGWAWLVPLYVSAGWWLAKQEDETLHALGRIVNRASVALLLTAALWSITDLSRSRAAAASHAVLVPSVALAAALWRRPPYLYAASVLALTAVTFGMTELDLTLAQVSVGWASLALLHLVGALVMGRRLQSEVPSFIAPVIRSGYAIAGLAILPPLFPYEPDLAIYGVGNWIGMAAWGVYLAAAQRRGFTIAKRRLKGLYHWMAALPLPFWLWMIYEQQRPTDVAFALILAVLGWGMVALSVRLARAGAAARWPWYAVGGASAAAAVVVALAVDPQGLAPGLTLLAGGLLAFADAVTARYRAIQTNHSALHPWSAEQLAPAGWIAAAGILVLLDRLGVSFDAATLGLSMLVALYVLAGLAAERRRTPIFSLPFLRPLYLASHALALFALGRVYARPVGDLYSVVHWTDTMKLWGAGAQLILGVLYGLFAWGRYQEGWAHLAAWLGTAAGGFIFIVYSQGRGSSAAKVAVMAVVFVLAERGLHHLYRYQRWRTRRPRAFFRLAWALYRRPLLVAGWALSAGAVGLALVRNLWLLGGGRTRQLWAIAGMLIVTALYTLAARLFRRPLFAWLAAALVVAPWTVLTDLGWFTRYRLTTPGFAASWITLAWALYGIGVLVEHTSTRAYGLPSRVIAHLLLPFSLFWGVADAETSRVTFGLAAALYGLAAWRDYRLLLKPTGTVGHRPERIETASSAGTVGHRPEQIETAPPASAVGQRPEQIEATSPASAVGQRPERIETAPLTRASVWLYPALGLIPPWCVALLTWYLPGVRHEHHGLMVLLFGPLGLLAGEWLRRRVPAGIDSPRRYALPAYLTGYAALIVGTMLVAHLPVVLAVALLFDAILMVVSARLFREPLWAYPAAVLAPLALIVALNQAGVDANRHGWWLIGLGALYLLLGYLFRRIRQPAYANAVLTVGFALVALGLPPSSQDRTGALWGYAAAVLIYAVTAFWLRQPLLLMAASGLVIVPYAVALGEISLARAYHGLALVPGAVLALAAGWVLDRRYGDWRAFPWHAPLRWLQAATRRILAWWALPLYMLGFGLAAAAPFLTAGRADLSSLNLVLLMGLCGWALARFRLRGWLLALGLAGHLAAARYLDHLGWWAYPAYAWLRFLPISAVTTLAALVIETRRGEGAPRTLHRALTGWSRPFYVLAAIDIVLAQIWCLNGTNAAAQVSVAHAVLLALVASAWAMDRLDGRDVPGHLNLPCLLVAYGALLLGLVALGNHLAFVQPGQLRVPVALARLALAYGVAGFGLKLARQYRRHDLESPAWLRVWEYPSQRVSLILSLAVLGLTAIQGIDLVGWTLRAMFGMRFRMLVDLATAQMVVAVLALLGLLYVAAAVAHRRLRLGYAAVGMLLLSWVIHAFYVRAWDGAARVQWYAIPAGLYLMSISALEWRHDHKVLARWLDYTALLLMLGSLFWQTLLYGWRYALLLGAEGLAALWWGSGRRLRRFLYGGMVGVILATLGQLIHSLQSVLQWILVSVVVGLALFLLGAFVERNLGRLKASLQEALETWE